MRALTRNPTPLDGAVFTRLFEWPGHVAGGAVEFYLWYAPMATLRTIAPWLREVAVSDGVSVHERAFLLRPLGRVDGPAAVAVARELLIESPWATSEVLGMFGGAGDLDVMRSALPQVASREEARTRRHFEAGMRKLERRLAIDGRPNQRLKPTPRGPGSTKPRGLAADVSRTKKNASHIGE